MRNWELAVVFTKALERFWGDWYKWGGQGRLKGLVAKKALPGGKSKKSEVPREGGLDCSGVIVEGFKCVGLLREGQDLGSAAMGDAYPEVDYLAPGCLCLWASAKDKPGQEKIVHVTAVVQVGGASPSTTTADTPAARRLALCIDAAGGDSGMDLPEEAAEKDAYVKFRTVYATEMRGKRLVKIVDPFVK